MRIGSVRSSFSLIGDVSSQVDELSTFGRKKFGEKTFRIFLIFLQRNFFLKNAEKFFGRNFYSPQKHEEIFYRHFWMRRKKWFDA